LGTEKTGGKGKKVRSNHTREEGTGNGAERASFPKQGTNLKGKKRLSRLGATKKRVGKKKKKKNITASGRKKKKKRRKEPE